MSNELRYQDGISPPGSACVDCRRPFVDGDGYSQRLVAVAPSVTVVEIVCLVCAFAAAVPES
jgi:hypothetical protein